MSKIIGMFNPCYTDNKKFVSEVIKTISRLQNDGQAVEVQYQPISLGDGQILYTAMILGRK